MSIGKVIETLETEIREYRRMIDEHTLCLAGESAYEECQSRIDFDREIIALLRTHQDAKPNEPKGDGWVSVDDRLPVGFDGMSICQNVIAYTVEGEVCTGWLNYKTWHLLCGNYDRYTKHGFGYVTHWRPLPEPPKEEHHEETP